MRTAAQQQQLEDLALIDCVETIRSHCIGRVPGLHARLEDLRTADYRGRTNDDFRDCMLAVVHGCDLASPEGARQVRRLASASRPADAMTAAEAPAAPASPPADRRMARSLAYFEREGVSYNPYHVAQRLAQAPGLASAVQFVRRAFPVLRGTRVFTFLSSAGYPAAVPSAHTRRFIQRFGIATDGADCSEVLQSLARLCGMALPELDLLLGLFTGARRDAGMSPVCAARPDCAACPLAARCAFVRMHGMPEPATARPIRTWSAEDRPRERMAGGGKLTDTELLAVILRTGNGRKTALDLARELLARHGDSLAQLSEASLAQLCAVPGVGLAKAASLRAAIELGLRTAAATQNGRNERPQVTTSLDVANRYRARFIGKTQEEFLLLTLNTKNRITGEFTVSLGTLNASIVHPRDVFRHAIEQSAAAVAFVHNHPSGDPAPSGEDRALTARLAECGRLLGIRVLDHVIVGTSRHFSFADNGDLA